MTDPFTPPTGDQPQQPGPPYGTPAYPAPPYPPPVYGAPPYAAPQYGAPQYGAPQYGAPQYGAPLPGTARNGFGVAALVLGILSIVTSWSVAGGILLGIGGIVFGILGRGRAKRGEATNGGVALAGTITGAVGIVFGALWIVFYVAIFNSDSVSNLRDCLDNAGSDQAKQSQCQTQFQHDFTK